MNIDVMISFGWDGGLVLEGCWQGIVQNRVETMHAYIQLSLLEKGFLLEDLIQNKVAGLNLKIMSESRFFFGGGGGGGGGGGF